MINKVKLDMCCLCGNCAKCCPKDAISFSREENLFLYPVIDESKCINCDICETVCPAINLPEKETLIQSFAAKIKDKSILKNSSSGGLFTAFAQTVISNGGVVFGAAFTNDFKVKHIAVESLEDLALLRGSKYLQSDLTDCFKHIETLLENGREVLFSGCPCQTAALKTFLRGNKYSGKLFLLDFICHGILSQQLFRDYISYLEKTRKSKVVSFTFRAKRINWELSGPYIVYENGKEEHWPGYEDLYMQGILQSICMRESCYNCSYKNFKSGSDVTISDFWGIKIELPDFYDNLGVSSLCIQTLNGLELFESSKDMLDFKVIDVEKISKHNKALIMPFEKNEKHRKFLKLIKRKRHIDALIKLAKPSLKQQMIRFLIKLRSYFSKDVKN